MCFSLDVCCIMHLQVLYQIILQRNKTVAKLCSKPKYNGVVMEKITYKPREQGHGHLVSPQAFSLLFEFFYHSPWWKTEDVPFADEMFKEKKAFSQNTYIWTVLKTDNKTSSKVILFLCSKFQMFQWLTLMIIVVIYFSKKKCVYKCTVFFSSLLLKSSTISVSSTCY